MLFQCGIQTDVCRLTDPSVSSIVMVVCLHAPRGCLPVTGAQGAGNEPWGSGVMLHHFITDAWLGCMGTSTTPSVS